MMPTPGPCSALRACARPAPPKARAPREPGGDLLRREGVPARQGPCVGSEAFAGARMCVGERAEPARMVYDLILPSGNVVVVKDPSPSRHPRGWAGSALCTGCDGAVRASWPVKMVCDRSWRGARVRSVLFYVCHRRSARRI